MGMIKYYGQRLLRRLSDPWPHVTRRTRTVRTLADLRLALGWDQTPVLEGAHLRAYHDEADLNQRPLRDAEVIGSACANGQPKILLEIGTSYGHTTALMARNAPQGVVHTVNIPPEEIAAGGKRVTFEGDAAIDRQAIGRYYREQGLTNIRQIFANTARWEPDFGPIDVAFIDGCHDADFVFHDTRKTLARCRPGSLILWHDFNPDLAYQAEWIGQVCVGIERLFTRKLIRGTIYHLQDSWVGLYRVP